MRIRLGVASLLTVILLLISLSPAIAEENIQIYLDGNLLEVSSEPIIENGTTLVPMRSIFEALGLTVNWDGANNAAIGVGNEITIQFIIGSNKAYINGIEKELLVPAKIVDGNTMVPLRFVSEALGCNIDLEGDSNRLIIKITTVNHFNTNELTDSNQLYAIDGTGKYAGYKLLRGYPGEDKFAIYYMGGANSYMTIIEDLRNINLGEVVSWNYNGNLYKSTRKELYSFFSNTVELSSMLGISNDTLSQDWFIATFGNVYTDWMQGIAYSHDAPRLVEQYFIETGQIKIVDRYESINRADEIRDLFEKQRIQEEERRKKEDEDAMNRIREFQKRANSSN